MDLQIKEIIYDYRKDNRLTQEQLAHKLGVTKATISQWESGKRVPSAALIIELSNESGIDQAVLYAALANQLKSSNDFELKPIDSNTVRRAKAYSKALPIAHSKESYTSLITKLTALTEIIESMKTEFELSVPDRELIDAYHNAPENIKSSIRMLLGINNED